MRIKPLADLDVLHVMSLYYADMHRLCGSHHAQDKQFYTRSWYVKKDCLMRKSPSVRHAGSYDVSSMLDHVTSYSCRPVVKHHRLYKISISRNARDIIVYARPLCGVRV
jgi:hypothetical protein